MKYINKITVAVLQAVNAYILLDKQLLRRFEISMEYMNKNVGCSAAGGKYIIDNTNT